MIFNRFDIPFNKKVEQFLYRTTEATESSKIERNSRRNVQKWKKNLTAKEIDRIYKGSYPVASQFYTDEEW